MNESGDRIRITEATVVLSDRNNLGSQSEAKRDKGHDIYKAKAKYLRGSILETVFRDFINTIRKENKIDSSMLEAGGAYSITVEVHEVINIDTLDRIRE